MNGFSSFMTYAMLAVFAQNMAVRNAAGLSCVLASAEKKSKIFVTALFVSIFAALGSLAMLPFNRYFSTETSYMPVHGALMTLAVVICYFIIANILSKFKDLYESIGEYIAPAAFNGVVMGIPLLLNFNGRGSIVSELLGMGIGAGIGFLLASLIVSVGLDYIDRSGVPKAFSGAPLMLVYIGLVSMTFTVFDGANVFTAV